MEEDLFLGSGTLLQTAHGYLFYFYVMHGLDLVCIIYVKLYVCIIINEWKVLHLSSDIDNFSYHIISNLLKFIDSIETLNFDWSC